MKIHLKIPEQLLRDMRQQLRMPHAVAFERVGFIACRGGACEHGIVLLAHTFLPVADADYEVDSKVGARISAQAIRQAMQYAYNHPRDVMLFVHEHAHTGKPHPSRTDDNCWSDLIPSFWHVTPDLPHGALILSEDSASGLVWLQRGLPAAPLTDVTIVGLFLNKCLREGRAA